MKTARVLASIPPASPSESPVLGVPDTVTRNRSLPLVDPEGVPSPPREFRESKAAVKRELRKIPESQRAEALAALAEAAGKGARLQVDLGRYAPPAPRAEALLERARVVRDGQTRALALLAYFRELEDINNHDVMAYLGALRCEALHVAEHAPQVRSEYPSLMALVDQRRESILEGRARAASSRAKVSARRK
jgi:hypothetical protein